MKTFNKLLKYLFKTIGFVFFVLNKILSFILDIFLESLGDKTQPKDSPYVLDKDNNEVIDDRYSHVYNFDNPHDFKRR